MIKSLWNNNLIYLRLISSANNLIYWEISKKNFKKSVASSLHIFVTHTDCSKGLHYTYWSIHSATKTNLWSIIHIPCTCGMECFMKPLCVWFSKKKHFLFNENFQWQPIIWVCYPIIYSIPKLHSNIHIMLVTFYI